MIGEIKRASSSLGDSQKGANPVLLARAYKKAGVAAISVLTESEYFKGSLGFLSLVHEAVPNIPFLRKDFIIHPIQLYETKFAGASSVLLILSLLGKKQAKN